MVSASQSTNPLGAQVILDGGVPRTFTAKAREVISGGVLVNTSGATGDVGSQVSSYKTSDIQVVGAQDAKLFNGIALNNAGSNELVTVATKGAYLMRCGGIVSGGALVGHNASGNVLNILNAGSVPTTTVPNTIVGRAITTAASGTNNFALVQINA